MRRFTFLPSFFTRVANPRRKLQFESLEDRATPATAELIGSTLFVDGDDFTHDILVVRQTNQNTIEVFDGWFSRFVPIGIFNRSAVSEIVVNGFDGNDLIDLNSVPGGRLVALNVPARVSGGDGFDNIAGGSMNDTLRGGAGNDAIFGNLGDDLIEGNEGFDNLNGSDWRRHDSRRNRRRRHHGSRRGG